MSLLQTDRKYGDLPGRKDKAEIRKKRSSTQRTTTFQNMDRRSYRRSFHKNIPKIPERMGTETAHDKYITSPEYIYGYDPDRVDTHEDDSDMSGSTPGDR